MIIFIYLMHFSQMISGRGGGVRGDLFNLTLGCFDLPFGLLAIT